LLPNVTTTLDGRMLRRMIVRRPTDCLETGQPPSVVSVTAFQSLVTVACRVTLNTARLGSEAPLAVLARTASRQTRPRPQVIPE